MSNTRRRADLAAILSRSLGDDAAAREVGRVADGLGLPQEISALEALQILDGLAAEPGILGIAARFAKARVHLAWDKE
jgi:hypothetical protein